MDERTGSPPTNSGRRGWWRVAIVVALTLFGVYLVRLATGGVALRRAGEHESRLSTAVAIEETEVGRINEAVTTAESDEYAQQWARENRNLAQPGDRVVVPVPAATDATGTTEDAGDDEDWWQRFRNWLSGD